VNYYRITAVYSDDDFGFFAGMAYQGDYADPFLHEAKAIAAARMLVRATGGLGSLGQHIADLLDVMTIDAIREAARTCLVGRERYCENIGAWIDDGDCMVCFRDESLSIAAVQAVLIKEASAC
jgi:hypothetical protein